MRPLVAMAAVVGLTVACSSPTSPTPGTITRLEPLPTTTTTPVFLARGTMSATVDGAPWDVSGPFASYSGSVVGTAISASIIGRIENAATLLSVTVPVAVGTYSFGGTAYLNFAITPVGGSFFTIWMATPFTTGSSATVTVTAASTTRLTGTFAFTAVAAMAGTSPEKRVVTNGAFDLTQ